MPTQQVSFLSPQNQAELQRIQYQQALAQQLMQSGGVPDEYRGQRVTPTYGIGQGLTDMATKLTGAYMQKKADESSRKLSERMQAERQKALADMLAPQAESSASGGAEPYNAAVAKAMAARDAGVPDEIIKPWLDAQVKHPASVAEYEFARRNGFTGTFEEWQTKARAQAAPADVQSYEYFSKLSPEQQQQYLKLKRNVGSDFAIETVNGVPTVVYKPAAGGNSSIPLTTPLTSLPSQAAGASEIKRAEGQGSALGQAQGTIAGGIQTKGSNANSTKTLLDLAEPLIDVATGSAGGAAVDALARVFGRATNGAEAIAKLKVLQAGLMTSMPRMEGPQSDRDVQLYREAAGQIGDPTVPAAVKKAAVETIRQIQDKYIERATGASAPAKTPKRVKVDAQGNVIQQ